MPNWFYDGLPVELQAHILCFKHFNEHKERFASVLKQIEAKIEKWRYDDSCVKFYLTYGAPGLLLLWLDVHIGKRRYESIGYKYRCDINDGRLGLAFRGINDHVIEVDVTTTWEDKSQNFVLEPLFVFKRTIS